MFSIMCRVLNSNIWDLTKSKNCFSVIRCRTAESSDIKISRICKLCRESGSESTFAPLICRDSNTGLTDIIPSGPCKVTDYMWQFFHKIPVSRNLRWIGLTSYDYTVRVIFSISLITCSHIIISCNIYTCACFFQSIADCMMYHDFIQISIHQSHEVVDISINLSFCT